MNNTNVNLNNARAVRNDEFYTELSDVNSELNHYRSKFYDKVVYCNCDDWRVSNFFRYFQDNFNSLRLKGLICTGYNADGHGSAYYYFRGDSKPLAAELDGNGDFRSAECMELLKEADIVVTNVPFSMFGQFIKLMTDSDMKFIVMGNMNAVTYKDVFPYIRDGKMWLGYDIKAKFFTKPDGTKQRMGNVCWFTNLTTDKENNPVSLTKSLGETDCGRYDNYDAYDVGRIADIPADLPVGSVVGVPITIISKVASDGLIHFYDRRDEEEIDVEDYEFEIQMYDTYGESLGYDIVSYGDIADIYGKDVADSMVRREGRPHGNNREWELDGLLDTKPKSMSLKDVDDVAKRVMPTTEYFKGVRGFILYDGTIVETEAEHNMCSVIDGIEGTFDFIRLGNIRIMPESIDMDVAPTPQQRRVLMRMLSDYENGKIYIDLNVNSGGLSVVYRDYDANMVMNEIYRYFREGIKPSGAINEGKQIKKDNMLYTNTIARNAAITDMNKDVRRELEADLDSLPDADIPEIGGMRRNGTEYRNSTMTDRQTAQWRADDERRQAYARHDFANADNFIPDDEMEFNDEFYMDEPYEIDDETYIRESIARDGLRGIMKKVLRKGVVL